MNTHNILVLVSAESTSTDKQLLTVGNEIAQRQRAHLTIKCLGSSNPNAESTPASPDKRLHALQEQHQEIVQQCQVKKPVDTSYSHENKSKVSVINDTKSQYDFIVMDDTQLDNTANHASQDTHTAILPTAHLPEHLNFNEPAVVTYCDSGYLKHNLTESKFIAPNATANTAINICHQDINRYCASKAKIYQPNGERVSLSLINISVPTRP